MSYIVRRKAMGAKTTPMIVEQVNQGMKIFLSDESLPQDDDYCFRWGTTGGNPGKTKVINKASAIEKTSDKRAFRLLLSQHGLAPKSWANINEYILSDSYSPAERLLTRPEYHERSNGMFLSESVPELLKATQSITGPYYISRMIEKTREFRVFVAQNRVVWMIEKLPKDKTATSWGCVSDGEFEYVGWSEWPMHVCNNALASMQHSGLDFGAVDVIVGQKDDAYTCEVNTAPYLTPYYAKAIGKVFAWILKNGRDHFPDTELEWKKIIHPAIKDF